MKNAKIFGLLGIFGLLSIVSVATFGGIQNSNPMVDGSSESYFIEFNAPLEDVKPMDAEHPEKHEDYIKVGVGRLGEGGNGISFQIREGEAVDSAVYKLNSKYRYNFGNEAAINGIYKIEGDITGTCELNYGFAQWDKDGRTEVSGEFEFVAPFSFSFFDLTLYGGEGHEVIINSLKIYYTCIDVTPYSYYIKDFASGNSSVNIDAKYAIKGESTVVFDVLYKTDDGIKFMLGDGWSYYSGYHSFNKSQTGWFEDGIYAEGIQANGWYRYIIKLGAAKTNMVNDKRMDFWENFKDVDLLYFEGNTASGTVCLHVDNDYEIATPIKTVSFAISASQTVNPTGISINSKITVDLHIQSVSDDYAQISMYGLKNTDGKIGDDWGGNVRVRFWKDGGISDGTNKSCNGVSFVKTYTDGDVTYNRYQIDLAVAPFVDGYRPNCLKFIYTNSTAILMKLVNVQPNS